MIKHIYFHIGMLKTGTTSLQEFLYFNRALLEESGIGFYVPKDANWRQKRANGDFLLSQSKKSLFEFSKYAKMFDNLLISEELFWIHGIKNPGIWKRTYDLIKQLVDDTTIVHPVIYIRRQDEWILSAWKEWLTHPKPFIYSFDETLQHYKDNQGLDYYTQLKNIESVFGKENMIVRVYEKKRLKKEDICYDFLSALKLPWNDDFKVLKDSNQSITLDVANALLFIYKGIVPYVISDQYNSSLRNAARLYSRMFPEKDKVYMMDLKERKALLSYYERSNRKTSESFLNGECFLDKTALSGHKWEKDNIEIIKIAQEIIKLSKTSNIVKQALSNYIIYGKIN